MIKNVKYSDKPFQVRNFVDMEKEGQLILNPDIQRRFFWTISKSSKIIDSILINAPIPSVFLNETRSGDFEVIDGQQRLTSIISFVNGVYEPTGKPFELILSKTHPLYGMTFKQLPTEYRKRLLSYTINTVSLDSDNDPRLAEEIFLRLNCGSAQTNAMELRNCTRDRNFPDFLNELSNIPLFRKMSGFKTPNQRMLDIEWILAFIAYYNRGHNVFTSSMQRTFLSSEFDRLKNITDDEKQAIRVAFKLGLDNCKLILGNNAFWTTDEDGNTEFRNTGCFGLFTTLMTTFARIPSEICVLKREELRRELVDNLQNNYRFRECIRKNKKSNIIYRHKTMETFEKTFFSDELFIGRE